MPSSRVLIINKLGLHARAAAKFVGVASTYPCQVRIGRSAESLVIVDEIMDKSKVYAIKLFNCSISTEAMEKEIQIMK